MKKKAGISFIELSQVLTHLWTLLIVELVEEHSIIYIIVLGVLFNVTFCKEDCESYAYRDR